MEYERVVIIVGLLRMGEEDSSSSFTDEDMDRAIDQAIADRLADGWEQDGLVRRDGPSAEIPVRRPGSGELGRQQIRALAHLLFSPIPGGDGAAEG